MSDPTTQPVTVHSTSSDDPPPPLAGAPTLNTVEGLGDAHQDNAAKIETLSDRLEGLAAKVETLASEGASAAETGAFGPAAQEGGGIMQEIINFLHHHFPGQKAPGKPTVITQQDSDAAGDAELVALLWRSADPDTRF